MNGRNGDDCGRLATAVVDGRYLEDPEAWDDHVAVCPACRELVDGLLTLKARIDRAAHPAPENGDEATHGMSLIDEAFRRYRRLRRIQGLSLGLVALIGLALGIVFLTRRSTEPEPMSAVAYATMLHDRVFGVNGQPDYELLKRDAALRAEHVAALDHESGLVRRAALQTLMFSGITLDPARVESILTTWDERLEVPIEVAAAGGGRRHLENALARWRVDTLRRVLSGACVQAEGGGPCVDPSVIEPYVDHPDPSVRASALMALAGDATYRPGERILRRMEVETNTEAAKFAADLLIGHLGDEGVAAVVARLRMRPDWALEGVVLALFGDGPEGVAFSRERVLGGDVPPRVALAHLRRLERLEEAVPTHDAVLQRALHDDDPRSWSALAQYASQKDLVALRKDLQTRWAECPPGTVRTQLAVNLVLWDCRSEEEGRQRLALDILEVERDPRLKLQAQRLATSGVPGVRERARDLLEDW